MSTIFGMSHREDAVFINGARNVHAVASVKLSDTLWPEQLPLFDKSADIWIACELLDHDGAPFYAAEEPSFESDEHGFRITFHGAFEARHYLRALGHALSSMHEPWEPPGDSPIEKRFARAWANIAGFYPASQVSIGPYRVDFMLPNKTVVECDGHEHHSTREQRSRDARRDRDLMALGYKVIRFTGTEIHRDSSACAAQAMSIDNNAWREAPAGEAEPSPGKLIYLASRRP